MEQILKRLELIKAAIAVEDEEVILLQIFKLKALSIDEKVEEILLYLEVASYTKALAQIESYILNYSGVVLYEDKKINTLKLELKALEQKLQEMSERKNEYLNDVNEFNVEYSLRLGESIQNILKLKEEILQKEVEKRQEVFIDIKNEHEDLKQEVNDLEEELEKLDEFDDAYDELYEELQKRKETLNKKRKETKQAKRELEDDESFQQYEKIKDEHEEFNREHEEVISQDRFELNEEETKELKKLFRQASRICHPDIVADEHKEQAHEVMAKLNEAYGKKDLQQIKKILASLQSGIVFDIASDKIRNSEVLKEKISDIREKIDTVTIEIQQIREDGAFKTIQEIDDWNEYFRALKNDFEHEVSRLESVLEEIGQ